jgi:lambda family phage portal protein
MNLIDRTIELFAPEWAVSRALARLTLERTRDFKAAQAGRRTDGWYAPSSSSNAENQMAMERLRNRARDLRRNNPHAASAGSRFAQHVIGTGILPRLEGADKPTRAKFSADWQAFVENACPDGQLDFYGQCKLAIDAAYSDGESLILLRPRPTSFKLAIPLQVEVLEADFLDHLRTEALSNGNVIIQGVEYDRFGRRVAYYLYDRHPGEVIVGLGQSLISHRIPADQVIHCFNPLRPGQVRGVSAFAPVALKLYDLDAYADAELLRKKIEACFAVFVKKPAGSAPSSLGGGAGWPTIDSGGKSTGQASSVQPMLDGRGRPIDRIAPGMTAYVPPGGEISFGTPQASGEFSAYMTSELHAVAAGLGVTYEMMTGDLRGVNYSSIREGKLEFWQVLDHWQWNIAVHQIMRRVTNQVQRLRTAMGQSLADGQRIAYQTPARQWTDPEKEIKAKNLSVRAGFASLRSVIAQSGEDPDEVFDEIQATNQLLDEKGLILDSDPRRVSATGGPATPAPTDTADPAPQDPAAA